jgi:small-conductance mechanosensitive channel
MKLLSDLMTLDFARQLGLCLAITIAWVLVVWLLVRIGAALRRKVRAMIDGWTKRHHVTRMMRTRAIQPARLADFFLRVAGGLLILIVTYEWLVLSLEQFAATRPAAANLNGALYDAVAQIGGAAIRTLPDLVVVVIIVWLTLLLVKISNAFFSLVEEESVRFERFDAEAARATRKLVAFGLWIFALVMAYPYLPGSQSDAFKGVSVLLGLMLSLGSSSIVSQAFSGLILIYSRALRPGEYVRIGDNEGTVLEIGLFATHIESGIGERIVLPNSQVVATATRNYSRPAPGGRFVVQTAVSIGYDVPWRQVHALLLNAAQNTPGIVTMPEAYVLQTALSDFYVEYRLVAFSDIDEPGRRAATISALHQHIQDQFNQHGVQIMSPHYLGDPPDAKVVPREKWFASPAKPE